jgi:predicted site-specific integrase-resolvase
MSSGNDKYIQGIYDSYRNVELLKSAEVKRILGIEQSTLERMTRDGTLKRLCVKRPGQKQSKNRFYKEQVFEILGYKKQQEATK